MRAAVFLGSLSGGPSWLEWAVFRLEGAAKGMGTLMNRQGAGGHGSHHPPWLEIRHARRRKVPKILEMFEVKCSVSCGLCPPLSRLCGVHHQGRRGGRLQGLHRHGRFAAALPGAVAALTTKPVIGVPCGGRVPYDSSSPSCSYRRACPPRPSVWTAATTLVTSLPNSRHRRPSARGPPRPEQARPGRARQGDGPRGQRGA